MNNHGNKCCCIYCSKELYSNYIDKHIKSCKFFKTDLIEKIDYVKCPICGKKLKEINNDHLYKIHNLTCEMFDKLYPNFDRLSSKSRYRKNTWLGRKHTNDELVKMKIGMKGKKHRPLTEDEKKLRSIKSKENWVNNRDMILFSRSLNGYIKKYGINDGTKKYRDIKPGPKSIINKTEFEIYKNEVDRFSRMSIKYFNLNDINKRSRKYHLDHKISKYYGFINNIPPYVIGSIYNLEIIDRKINCSKQHYYNSIDIDNLIEKVNNDIFYINFRS